MCDGCHQDKPTRSAVINGKFGEFCDACIEDTNRLASGRAAQYARDRDREHHAKDLIQPWDANGRPNREFIRNYPAEAKTNFTEEEIEKYG